MKRHFELLLLLCFFLNLLSLEAGNPFLPLFLKTLSHGNTAQLSRLSALALSAPMIGMIIFSPLWGRLADKFGSKKMVIRASLALSIFQLFTALCQSPESLILTRFFQGVFAGFITAMQTYALVMCVENKKGLLLSRMQSAKALATSFGAVIGGILLAFLPYEGIYLFASGLTLLVTLVIWLYLPSDESSVAMNRTSIGKSVVSRELQFVLLLVLLSQMAKFLPSSMFAFYAEMISANKPQLIGLLYAAPGIMILVSAECFGRLFDKICNYSKRLGHDRLIFIYFSLLCGFAVTVLALQSLTHKFTLVFCLRLLWGVVLGALLPGLMVYLSERSQKKGMMLGVANSVAKLGNFSGIYLGAFAVGFIRLEQVFLLMAGVYFFMSLGSLTYTWRLEKMSYIQKVTE